MSGKGAGGGGSAAQARKSFSIIAIVKELPKTVISALSIEDVVTSCRLCGGRIHHGEEFCSQHCAVNYWGRLRQESGKASGRWFCSLPGCDKPCYIESNGRVHDYCTKTHAKEHEKMKAGPGNWFFSWLPRTPSASHHQQHGGTSKFGSGASSPPTSTANIGGRHSAARYDSSGTGPIYFYDKFAPYYEFTNFYSAPIFLDERTWKTTEHYFQAQKFIGTPYLDVIQMCATPREAFDFSRKPFVSRWRRNDWEGIKIDIMRKALLAKFLQHDDLRKKLKGTGKRPLVERSPYDKFWGDGGDGSGQNWLGRLLVEIRDAID